MKEFIDFAKSKFNVDRRLIVVYCLVYFLCGVGMNWFGIQMEIAKFTYWWQVITCYIVYMVPISLILRGLPFHQQYAYGLVTMGLLEFGGYTLRSSYAYPDNLLDQLFSPQNFALGMALFFALYYPAGDWVVGKAYKLIFKKEAP